MTDEDKKININLHSPGSLEIEEFKEKQAVLRRPFLKAKSKKEKTKKH
ncbi:MAG: hypothetical protein ACYC2T_14265 [Bacillota bacterium]